MQFSAWQVTFLNPLHYVFSVNLRQRANRSCRSLKTSYTQTKSLAKNESDRKKLKFHSLRLQTHPKATISVRKQLARAIIWKEKEEGCFEKSVLGGNQ